MNHLVHSLTTQARRAVALDRRVVRSAAVMALLLIGSLASASSAGAHETRVYHTVGVPARDDTPANQRLYAGLGGVGNGNQQGDPVVLATRASFNPRQQWWATYPTYPGYRGDVTGHGPGLCIFTLMFYWACKGFEGPAPATTKLRVKWVNHYSGKCLAVKGGGAVAHDYELIQWTCEENARDQMWWVEVTGDLNGTRSYMVPLVSAANSHTCIGPAQRTAGTAVRIFGGPGICPHWVLRPAVRDHRYPHTFVNPS